MSATQSLRSPARRTIRPLFRVGVVVAGEKAGGRTVWPTVVLIGLLVVGFALRWPALGDWSLYRDDAWQSLATRMGPVSEVVLTGVTAPGYAVVLRGWGWVFGDASVSLLIPSFLAGLVCILATTLLAKRFGLNWASALVAGAVMATGSVSVEYSARVKPFIFGALITVILTWFALATVENTTRTRVFYLALLASFAFVFSASSAPVAAIGIAAVVANSWHQRGERDVSILAAVCYAFVTFGWYFLVVRPATTQVLQEWWEGRFFDVSQGLSVVVRRGAAFVAGAGVENAGMVHHLALSGLIAAGLVTIAVRRRWLHGYLLLGPVIVTALLSALGVVPFGGGRTDLFLYPLISILAGYGIEAIAGAQEWGKRSWLAVGVTALVMAGLVARSEPTTYPEESGREITQDVLRLAEPTDLIMTLPETSYLWARYAPNEVGVARDTHAMTGFTPYIDDGRVLFLPGFEMSSTGPANLAAREHSLSLARDRLDVESPSRVWVVESTYFDSPFPELRRLLLDRRYAVSETVEREFAVARLYTNS